LVALEFFLNTCRLCRHSGIPERDVVHPYLCLPALLILSDFITLKDLNLLVDDVSLAEEVFEFLVEFLLFFLLFFESSGILLNPLADPYTLGISSGAAFGASLALLANVSMLGHFSTPVFAFVGAILTLILVMRLSTFNGQISAQTLILSGVIVGAILSAGISFLKYLADEQVAIIIFWLMGSFASSTWNGVLLVGASLIFGMLVTLYYGRDLNIMSLGRRSSDTLGVETAKVRKILLLTASLVTAICVAVTGIIGFIGLIVPHLMRYLVGPDNRKLLPVSALAGAILLLLADTMTRAVLPVEVPIGVLTALIGGPFFCIIFRQKQKGKSYE